MERVRLLNLLIDNLTKTELLQKLDQHGGIVFTPNVDHLTNLQNDQNFYEAYNISDYRVCDSQVLIYASKFLGRPLKEKISGSDFFPDFYTYNKNNESVKIFLLGAAEGVAKKAQEKINSKVGRNIIVAAHSPSFGFEKDETECQKIVDMINNSQATVLAIGVGAPKQEKWILKYKDKLKNIKVFLAIGATIDFEAGSKKRCPKWMSELGIEWIHRLVHEPRRLWKRYLVAGIPFAWLIWQQKLNLYQSPAYSHEKIEADQRVAPL